MKRIIVSLLCLCVLVSCQGKRKLIPASKMSDIYAEMFLADQWISSNYSARRQADTSLFYAPIFQKYGYDFSDYDYSVRYYVTKPDQYAKILNESAGKLDRKAKWLTKVDNYYKNRVLLSPYVKKEFFLDSLMFTDKIMKWPEKDIVNYIERP